MSSRRYRMTVAYDGTRYAGWQVQPGQVTIQSELERVLNELTGEKTRVHCSGRTDAGVHARAQVTHFDLVTPRPPNTLRPGFNAMLHDDIRVLGVQPAALDFDARKSAIGKQYRYFLWDGPVMPPCRRFYRFHTARPMDLAGMQEAAGRLQGRHDFAAFSANPNREVPSTIRTLRRLEVKRHGYAMTIIAESEGFLYKMVRSLAGFLIRVGEGVLSPDDGEEILRSRLRTARVPTAPPQGLFLWDVRY